MERKLFFPFLYTIRSSFPYLLFTEISPPSDLRAGLSTIFILLCGNLVSVQFVERMNCFSITLKITKGFQGKSVMKSNYMIIFNDSLFTFPNF